MRMSEKTGELAKALAAAQAEMKNPEFDAKNPHFNSQYASLAAVRNAVVPVLAKHGIAVLQVLRSSEGSVGCATLLLHTSGEWLDSEFIDVPVSKADAQGFVAAATYVKRTSLQAVAVVVGDHDDDGETASGRGAATGSERQPRTGKASPPAPGAPPAAKAATAQPTTATPLAPSQTPSGQSGASQQAIAVANYVKAASTPGQVATGRQMAEAGQKLGTISDKEYARLVTLCLERDDALAKVSKS